MPIPTPEPGFGMSFTYLWHHEHEGGREEGEKDRPSVIVLAVGREAEGATVVTVLPITHNPPADPASAVEILCRSAGILGSTLTDPGSSSPKATNLSRRAKIYASCRTGITTTMVSCHRHSSIRCSKPSSASTGPAERHLTPRG